LESVYLEEIHHIQYHVRSVLVMLLQALASQQIPRAIMRREVSEPLADQ